MIGRNVVTREIDAIENRALDWVRDNDQLVFAGVSLHLEEIRESMEHGNSRLMAIVDVLGTQWSNGPPGFTDRDTVLDTMAMAMLADSIRWDRVVLMWIAMHPSEHDRLEGLVS